VSVLTYTIRVEVPADHLAATCRAIEERLFEARLAEAVEEYKASVVLDRVVQPVTR
jgi:hypothetical protein